MSSQDANPVVTPEPVVGTWGPDAPKTRRPVGMGDVIVGLILMVTLPIIPQAIYLFGAIAKAVDESGAAAGTTQQVLDDMLTNGPLLASSLILGWVGLMLPTWWAATRKGDGDWRTLLKWRFKARVDIPIAVGFTAFFVLAQMGVSSVVQAMGIDPEGLSNTGIVTDQTGIWLVVMAVGASIGAPIVEELFFRGMFLSVAVRNWGKIAGVLVTSAVFGLMHSQATTAGTLFVVPQTALLGAVLAILVLRTQRLGTSIACHILFNTTGVVLSLIAANAA